MGLTWEEAAKSNPCKNSLHEDPPSFDVLANCPSSMLAQPVLPAQPIGPDIGLPLKVFVLSPALGHRRAQCKPVRLGRSDFEEVDKSHHLEQEGRQSSTRPEGYVVVIAIAL